MSQSNNLAKSFFEAVIAAAYITNPELRDRVMSELIATNQLIRSNSRRGVQPPAEQTADQDPEFILDRRH